MSESTTISSTFPPRKRVERRQANRLSATFYGVAGGLGEATGQSHWNSTWAPTQICTKAPKIAEAERQITRVKPYLNWLAAGEAVGVDSDGLNTSITLLYAIAQGPAPVPIMSIGNDGKSALYIGSDDSSVEINICGNSVEYFISGNDDEIFEEEMVQEGRIPAKLLGWLYSKFAENKIR